MRKTLVLLAVILSAPALTRTQAGAAGVFHRPSGLEYWITDPEPLSRQ